MGGGGETLNVTSQLKSASVTLRNGGRGSGCPLHRRNGLFKRVRCFKTQVEWWARTFRLVKRRAIEIMLRNVKHGQTHLIRSLHTHKRKREHTYTYTET